MILSAVVHFYEGDYAWTGTMELGDPAAYQRIRIDDPVTLMMGDSAIDLMVDNKTITRDGVNRPKLTVSLISPTARFVLPRAELMTKTWNNPTMARVAAEEAVGESIQWDLVDWLIPAGRLAFSDASPIDVVQTIARAAGGLVETTPSGVLRVRHRFPVPVPEWATAIPDHVLTDASHNLSCRESYRLTKRCNQVLVRGLLPQPDHLTVEIDNRPDGPNLGLTQFIAGGPVNLMVMHGPETNIGSVDVTAGNLARNADFSCRVTEDIMFGGSRISSLSKPAISIESVVWIGNNQGDLRLLRDGRTVQVDYDCVAMARVTYTARAKSWHLSTPTMAGGLNSYPVHVLVTGVSGYLGHDGEIICQRGGGEYPGVDISDPLLTSTDAKYSRGRAEIDD